MKPSEPDRAFRRDTFNRNAAIYTSGRPPYPERVYAFMEKLGALRTGVRVLEIGPGTGQATAELIRRGATVDAVELGADLAAGLREQVTDDRLTIRVGDIHTIELPEHAYDTVVAATMFHWLDTPSLLPRLARTLRPGGWLVVWWNVFGDPHVVTPFRQRVSRIFAEQLPSEWRPPDELPRAMQVDDRLRELTDGGWFGDPRHELIRWTHRMDAQGVRALFSTFPAIANQQESDRQRVLDLLAAAVDEEGGVVDDPFVTAIYAVRAVGVDRADSG